MDPAELAVHVPDREEGTGRLAHLPVLVDVSGCRASL